MKTGKWLILVLLGWSPAASFAQTDGNSPAIYESLPELTLVTSASASEKMGTYQLGGGLWGKILRLDSNRRFQIKELECLGGGIRDSGTWLVFGTGRIALNGVHGKQTFDLLQFDHFYFCVSPTERVAFMNDFRKSEAEFKGTKPVHLGDSVNTAKDLIAIRVMENHYLHDNRKPWAYLGLIQSPSAASAGTCPLPALPTIRFMPGRTTLALSARALLRQVGPGCAPATTAG